MEQTWTRDAWGWSLNPPAAGTQSNTRSVGDWDMNIPATAVQSLTSCALCDLPFADEDALLLHIRDLHTLLGLKASGVRFYLDQCKDVYRSLGIKYYSMLEFVRDGHDHIKKHFVINADGDDPRIVQEMMRATEILGSLTFDYKKQSEINFAEAQIEFADELVDDIKESLVTVVGLIEYLHTKDAGLEVVKERYKDGFPAIPARGTERFEMLRAWVVRTPDAKEAIKAGANEDDAFAVVMQKDEEAKRLAAANPEDPDLQQRCSTGFSS